jgi:outer membrane protein assembly factor BamE
VKTGFALAAIVFALAGCSSSGGKWGFPYRAPIQQGNWVTSEQVALLQPGMTREQVRFALGSPTLVSVLRSERWDYPYYYKPGYGASQERKLTVWFDNDKLTRWEGDEQPALQPFQIANQDVKRSENEEAKVDLDAERAKIDQADHDLTSEFALTPAEDAVIDTPGLPPGDAAIPLN